MAFIPVPLTVQAELIYSVEGQVVENVLHYQGSFAWDTGLMTELAAQLVAWFNTDGKAMHANELSLNMVRVTDIRTQTGGVVEYVTGLPIIGTWTGGVSPGNVAVCVTKRTPLRGRSYRGRMYLPGIPDSQVAGSYLTSAHLIIINAKVATLLTRTVSAGTAFLSVISRYNNNAPRGTGVSTIVSGMTANLRVDSQRRRLPGVGI